MPSHPGAHVNPAIVESEHVAARLSVLLNTPARWVAACGASQKRQRRAANAPTNITQRVSDCSRA